VTRPRTLPRPDPSWAYFLDFDGTLVPFAAAPERVKVDPALRAAILALYDATGGAVAIVTGRPLAQVDRLFRGVRLPAAGHHGLERRSAAGRLTRHASATPPLDRVRRELRHRIAAHPGLLLEDKEAALALHYRRAPRLASYAHRLAREAVARLGPAHVLRRGKRVVEIAPAGGDKGTAIAAFMREPPFRGRTPVFLGDDVTDEFGFRAVNRLRGHSIKVGAGATAAKWRLRDVRAVRGWLTADLNDAWSHG